ncbi:hypothetical protein T265_10159 [Opisthorchis viverrini]|uniref:Uncharacterized protein n=1 Tax=Opisthorchis viverrini TaxID=6198 RepID=A0A074Z398_OPIVI|nr:hypothetical protein T265_10159 [Opisthorchis viverrini]KER21536.1 hypothetical protein T265_10159 [Opisthorchis viverrini]
MKKNGKGEKEKRNYEPCPKPRVIRGDRQIWRRRENYQAQLGKAKNIIATDNPKWPENERREKARLVNQRRSCFLCFTGSFGGTNGRGGGRDPNHEQTEVDKAGNRNTTSPTQIGSHGCGENAKIQGT